MKRIATVATIMALAVIVHLGEMGVSLVILWALYAIGLVAYFVVLSELAQVLLW